MMLLENWVCFCVETTEKSKNGSLLTVEYFFVKQKSLYNAELCFTKRWKGAIVSDQFSLLLISCSI